MGFCVAILSGLLYRAGGMDQWTWCKIPFTNILINQKLWRWLMGIPIGLILWHGWFVWGLTILTYFLATNVFSYGDGNWTTKLLGKWGSMGLAGLTFGLASIFILGAIGGLLQGILGAVCFLGLKYLDDKNILKNPWQELLRGFLGTILYI